MLTARGRSGPPVARIFSLRTLAEETRCCLPLLLFLRRLFAAFGSTPETWGIYVIFGQT